MDTMDTGEVVDFGEIVLSIYHPAVAGAVPSPS